VHGTSAHRSEQVETFLHRLAQIDPAKVTPESMREAYNPSNQPAERKEQA
jgi:malonate decarboxylase beta subunit